MPSGKGASSGATESGSRRSKSEQRSWASRGRQVQHHMQVEWEKRRRQLEPLVQQHGLVLAASAAAVGWGLYLLERRRNRSLRKVVQSSKNAPKPETRSIGTSGWGAQPDEEEGVHFERRLLLQTQLAAVREQVEVRRGVLDSAASFPDEQQEQLMECQEAQLVTLQEQLAALRMELEHDIANRDGWLSPWPAPLGIGTQAAAIGAVASPSRQLTPALVAEARQLLEPTDSSELLLAGAAGATVPTSADSPAEHAAAAALLRAESPSEATDVPLGRCSIRGRAGGTFSGTMEAYQSKLRSAPPSPGPSSLHASLALEESSTSWLLSAGAEEDAEQLDKERGEGAAVALAVEAAAAAEAERLSAAASAVAHSWRLRLLGLDGTRSGCSSPRYGSSRAGGSPRSQAASSNPGSLAGSPRLHLVAVAGTELPPCEACESPTICPRRPSIVTVTAATASGAGALPRHSASSVDNALRAWPATASQTGRSSGGSMQPAPSARTSALGRSLSTGVRVSDGGVASPCSSPMAAHDGRRGVTRLLTPGGRASSGEDLISAIHAGRGQGAKLASAVSLPTTPMHAGDEDTPGCKIPRPRPIWSPAKTPGAVATPVAGGSRIPRPSEGG